MRSLLPQPGGFEGLLPPKEAANAGDPAVADQEVDGELLVEQDVAGPSLQLAASQPHNRVLQIAKLAFLDAKHLPSPPAAANPLETSSRPLYTGRSTAAGPAGSHSISGSNLWVMA